MTTKQIDYCIELAHTLNFSRAAENMFVSQPTFSYQIRLLEEEIGFTIFDRNGKGASLTPAGSQFVTYLTGMRQEMKRAIEQGQNFSAKYKDNITISLMVRQAVYFLPEAMRLFEEREPPISCLRLRKKPARFPALLHTLYLRAAFTLLPVRTTRWLQII